MEISQNKKQKHNKVQKEYTIHEYSFFCSHHDLVAAHNDTMVVVVVIVYLLILNL